MPATQVGNSEDLLEELAEDAVALAVVEGDALRELRDEIESTLKIRLPHLSMGMTDDFEVAIEEGATLVRVGRAIFGERN